MIFRPASPSTKSACAKLMKNDLSDMIRAYNIYALTRVYPRGTRITSSNYHADNRRTAWGVSWSRWTCRNMMRRSPWNEARFIANRGSGYILSSTIHNLTDNININTNKKLELTVLCGLLLPSVRPRGYRRSVRLREAFRWVVWRGRWFLVVQTWNAVGV